MHADVVSRVLDFDAQRANRVIGFGVPTLASNAPRNRFRCNATDKRQGWSFQHFRRGRLRYNPASEEHLRCLDACVWRT